LFTDTVRAKVISFPDVFTEQTQNTSTLVVAVVVAVALKIVLRA